MKSEQSDIYPLYEVSCDKVPWLFVAAASGGALFIVTLCLQVLGVGFSLSEYAAALALGGAAIGLKYSLGQRLRGEGGRGR